jgi:hypothetical protein
MLDLVKDFAKYEKSITSYIKERINSYDKSECKALLKSRITRLNSSWDMVVGGGDYIQNDFLGQISYPLVKMQIISRRAVMSNNFRADPMFTLTPIGNTPADNATNVQDLMESNIRQTMFRAKVHKPATDMTCKWGSCVVFTEYNHNQVKGWKTTVDPMMGATRKYGIIKSTNNAVSTPINPLNYFQSEYYVDNESSRIRGHRERITLAQLINRYNQNPELYIKENIEKVIKECKSSSGLDKDFYDEQGKITKKDYDSVGVTDVQRGQVQIHIDGNEDDETYYHFEMVNDKIVRFQDNPYDMNLNQYTIMTCEPRYDYWWGNTPAEYSQANEDRLNLLLGMSIENAIESMKRYIFYNKNGINPGLMNRAAHNAKIPVDVSPEVQLNNLLFTYQVPDLSSKALGDAYARILENDQRLSSSPDLSRPTAMGGQQNNTATAATILTNKGDIQDADILEYYSNRLVEIGKNHSIILVQFLGNFGPVLISPQNKNNIRIVEKSNLVGDYEFSMDTALQKSYMGEISRYQNIVTWMNNLIHSGVPIQPNFVPLIKQILKMGQFLRVDEVLPDQPVQPPMGVGVPPMPVAGRPAAVGPVTSPTPAAPAALPAPKPELQVVLS